jgi:hypothetical protein
MTKQIEASAEAAQAAAEATNQAKGIAVAAAKESAKLAAAEARENRNKDRRQSVASDWYKIETAGAREKKAKATNEALTLCADVATQAKGAASVAKTSIAALAAKNDRAAQINAAVAGVDAADAAVFAARSAAKLADIEKTPAVIEATEDATAAARISMLWQVIPYILMTVAEVCISVVGLELAFAAAPASMKTFMTACWLLAIFVGNFANGFITPLYNTTFWGISLTPDWYFLWFAVAMVPVTLAFMVMSRRFNRPASG